MPHKRAIICITLFLLFVIGGLCAQSPLTTTSLMQSSRCVHPAHQSHRTLDLLTGYSPPFIPDLMNPPKPVATTTTAPTVAMPTVPPTVPAPSAPTTSQPPPAPVVTPPTTTISTAPPQPVPVAASSPLGSVTPEQYAEWTKVAVCEEGGWIGYAGPAYPDSLGISAVNWYAYGGGTDLSPDAQILVAERIQFNPPDQYGCAAW